MKAALYCRVSTEEQAKSGYSLRQQIEALRRYCDAHDLEVVGVFEDRSSGASLDRPGLDTLRDVVSEGGIDLVLCQDRDRISREPARVYLLREEFLGHGTTLRSLNDRGDDSPEGELHDAIIDQLAKFERAKTLERTRRGKLQKARSGKVIGTGKPPYGFYYKNDHYHVDKDRMVWVHRIFDMIADGHSFYEVIRYLRNSGAIPPGGAGGKWHRATIRYLILNDAYLGTYWWGRKKSTTTTVSGVENGERVYKKRVKRQERPREEWIAIPVPDSGIPTETVARARESIKDNVKWVSKNSGRTWELSGGVGVCSECGRNMVSHTTRNSAKKAYYYYRCPDRENLSCSHRKLYSAGDLETRVKDALEDAFRPETWSAFVDDVCDRKLEDLRKWSRSDPSKTKESLAGRIKALETKIFRARELFIDGDLPRPDYEEKKSTLQDEIDIVQEELTKVDDLDAEIRRVEGLRETLLSIENPLSGHYTLTSLPEDLHALEDYDVAYGSVEKAAKRRQEFYRRMGMQVKVGEELEITLGVNGISVSKSESFSGTICWQTIWSTNYT
jgi:site-specific DNA recombinase